MDTLIRLNKQNRQIVWWTITIVFASTYGFLTALGMTREIDILFIQVFLTLSSLFVVQTYNDISYNVYKWFDSAVAIVTAILTITCIVPVFTDVGESYLKFCAFLSISLLVVVWGVLLEDDSDNHVGFVLLTLAIIAQAISL